MSDTNRRPCDRFNHLGRRLEYAEHRLDVALRELDLARQWRRRALRAEAERDRLQAELDAERVTDELFLRHG